MSRFATHFSGTANGYTNGIQTYPRDFAPQKIDVGGASRAPSLHGIIVKTNCRLQVGDVRRKGWN